MFYDAMANVAATIHPKDVNRRTDFLCKMYSALGQGLLTDEQSEALRKQVMPSPAHHTGRVGALAPLPVRYFIDRSPEQRSPDRRASIARRKHLAASGMLPPHLAARLTQGEQAVATIVAAEYLAHGICDLSRNAIAARAGVCHSHAKATLLKLESIEFGWLKVTRRPRSGRKNLTNLTKIVDRDWLAWLALGARKAAAIKSCAKARPDFRNPRGLKNSPPRSQDFRTVQNSPADPRIDVGKGAKSERR